MTGWKSVGLDNRNSLLKIKQLDKITYTLKNLKNFSFCHLTWMKLLPGDNIFSIVLFSANNFFSIPPISLRTGKGLLSPQCPIIIHVNYPFYLWFLSSLTFSTLMTHIFTPVFLYISYLLYFLVLLLFWSAFMPPLWTLLNNFYFSRF